MTDENEKISSLIDALEHPDKLVIRRAVDALIEFAGRQREVATTLNQLLADTRRKNLWPLAYVLANLPSPSQTVLKVLMDTLGSQDSEVRWAVALLLIRLAKTDQQLASYLLELLSKGTAIQKRMVLYCLRDLGLEDEVSLQALLNSLRDSDPMVRVAAVISSKSRRGCNAESKKLLMKLFSEDPDSRVRNVAAVALAQLGWDSEEFRQALAGAGQSDNARESKAASAALALLQKKRSAPSGS